MRRFFSPVHPPGVAIHPVRRSARHLSKVELATRIPILEATLKAFRAPLPGRPTPVPRSTAVPRSGFPKGNLETLIVKERGWPLWNVFTTLLDLPAQREVAWGCWREREHRRRAGEPSAPIWHEIHGRTQAADLLDPARIVDRELGIPVGWAVFDPLYRTPVHLEGVELTETEQRAERFAELGREIIQLATERLIDRVRAGGPVCPGVLLQQLLAREAVSLHREEFFPEDLIREHCNPRAVERVLTMLGKRPSVGIPPGSRVPELETPSALMGMFGISLLQNNQADVGQYAFELLAQDSSRPYQEILLRRAVLESTARLFHPPDRYVPPDGDTPLFAESA